MSFTLTPLLIHSEHVPEEARAALRAVDASPAEQRAELLESAARILYDQTELDCRDVRELVGLPAGDCG